MSAAHAYLHSRIAIFAAQLLSVETIERLARLSLEELNRTYGLTALPASELAIAPRLRAVETALIHTLLNELSILLRPMSSDARELLIHWARKFELLNLKTLIRGKLHGLDIAEISATLHDLPDYLTLPHQALLRTESVLELLRQLERGPYRSIANQARQAYEAQHESFALEATLDQRYYAGMLKRTRNLCSTDRQETQTVVGLHLDRVNLLWLLRYRYRYQLSPSETYYQLTPSPLYLQREILLRLVNLPDLEQLLAALPEPLRHGLDGATDSSEVERRLQALTAQRLRGLLRHGVSPVARALAYLILREQDLRRVFTVIQSQVLNLRGEVLNLALGFPINQAAARL